MSKHARYSSFLLITFLFFCSSVSARIAFIDRFSASDTKNLESRRLIALTRCFSNSDDKRQRFREIGEDRTILYEWMYKYASGCPSGTVSGIKVGERSVPSIVFTTNDGDGDPNDNDAIRHYSLGDNHGSDVAFVASQQGATKLVLLQSTSWSSPVDHPSGSRYLSASLLQPKSIDGILASLDWLNQNHDKYGIKIVNYSQSYGYFKGNDYCDGKRMNSDQQLIYQAIMKLVQKGVIFVASGGSNPEKYSQPDEAVMAFPACLKYVYSLGKYRIVDGKKYYNGARSLRLSFVDGSTYATTVGGTDTSTSLGAGELSGQIAELQSIRPDLTPVQIHNLLYESSDLVGRIYYPNTKDKKYNTNGFEVNFERAKASITDSFWDRFLELFFGQTNTYKAGWNYGTNQHENGLLTYFNATSAASSKTTANKVLTTKTIQSQSLKVGDSALRYSFRAFDIDTEDEVQIIVNDKHFGYIKTTASDQLGEKQTLCIDPIDMAPDGKNKIKLKLKNAKETWGVTDLKIEMGGGR